MYRRKENIEVENLDWDNHLKPSPISKEALIEKNVLHSGSQQNDKVVYTETDLANKLDIRKKVLDTLDENVRLFFIFMLLIFPYVLGFLFFYFLFYIYGNMNIHDFLTLQQGHLYFESWVIGMHILITVGTIWIVIKSLFGAFKR